MLETTTTGTNFSYTYNNYCEHRLPCGVCKLTNARCPLQGQLPYIDNPPSWPISPTIICEAKSDIKN